MSTTNIIHNELITCDLCKRHYNINVYKRHITESQCLKRNHHRLQFQSIKQRSVRIGDKTFSVQQQQQKNTDVQISAQQSNNQEKRKEQISHNNKQQAPISKILPSNNRRRTLEQAKQLLERRIKYKPPWAQKQSNTTNDVQSKINRIDLPAKNISNNPVNQERSPKKSHSHERPSPPTTIFKTDNLPIKVSDRCSFNHTRFQQPVLTQSPKIRTSQASTTSKYQASRVDRTFSNEQTDSLCRPMRKAYTWTRPSKQSSIRDVFSPIQIPTFSESSRVQITVNQNHGDDDDEFERYSPTPPSTPKHHENKIGIKNILPSIKQNFILQEQQTLIRPITYQRTKRLEPQQHNETSTYPCSIHFSPKQVHRKNPQSTFHLPPINPSSYPKLKHRPTINPTPWR